MVGGPGDSQEASAVARRRRDDGDEVVLLGGGHAVQELGSAVVAEDAVEVAVVGTTADADALRAWLAERGLAHVEVSTVGG